MMEDIRLMLIDMQKKDLDYRTFLEENNLLMDGYNEEMERIHIKNGTTLSDLLDKHGWLHEGLVGKDGENAAWMILMNAISLPALQRSAYELLKESSDNGESPASYAAYLYDRICFFERRPQRYGTQFDWNEEGVMAPWTIEDASKVDALRMQVGLGDFEESKRNMSSIKFDSSRVSLQERNENMHQWLVRVGWLKI